MLQWRKKSPTTNGFGSLIWPGKTENSHLLTWWHGLVNVWYLDMSSVMQHLQFYPFPLCLFRENKHGTFESQCIFISITECSSGWLTSAILDCKWTYTMLFFCCDRILLLGDFFIHSNFWNFRLINGTFQLHRVSPLHKQNNLIPSTLTCIVIKLTGSW